MKTKQKFMFAKLTAKCYMRSLLKRLMKASLISSKFEQKYKIQNPTINQKQEKILNKTIQATVLLRNEE
jgi:hypothetical protein